MTTGEAIIVNSFKFGVTLYQGAQRDEGGREGGRETAERERVTRCKESGGGKGGGKEMRESRKRGVKRLSLLFVY